MDRLPRHVARVGATIASLSLALVCAMGAATATTLLRLDMTSLVANSDAIVIGRVAELRPRVEGGRVLTYVDLEVDEYLLGAPADEDPTDEDDQDAPVVVRVLGGRTAERATRVAGTAVFAHDERVLVFLERPAPSAPYVVTGMAQGKFRIGVGPDETTRYVIPNLENARIVMPTLGPDGRRRLRSTSPAALYRRVTPLDDFVARVRDELGDSAKGGADSSGGPQ
jgi:hypothetical protein